MLAGIRESFSAVACTACAGVFLAALAAPAGAQSLSLSYGLDPAASTQAPKVSPGALDRCSGLSWAASLAAACNAAQAFVHTVVAGIASHEVAAAREPGAAALRRVEAPGAYSAADAQSPRYELPQLGSSAEARVFRAGEPGGSRSPDVNLRFGSRYRMRNGDEGWETYRFNDVTTENRTQSNGMRNLGVELTFPFQ
jgi:hypothetical protein